MAPKQSDMLARLQTVETKVGYIDGHMRKRAACLLFMGSLFGMFGFAFAFICGFIKFLNASDEYPSGNGYFPSTVSEMVSNPRDPAGKAFFAFEFVGALFIFLSWYPWELRSVYIGDDDRPCFDVSWTMFRQFLPAPGMMLVATVTTTPTQTATIRDWFTIFIHLNGAMMMFMGYLIIEMKTLGWYMSPPTPWVEQSPIGAQERRWRIFFCRGILYTYALFFGIQIILGVPGVDSVICCNDIWETVPGLPGMTLMNTAHSKMFILKLASYVGEVVCGWSLICSHMAIWYFSAERHVDLEDVLEKHVSAPLLKN